MGWLSKVIGSGVDAVASRSGGGGVIQQNGYGAPRELVEEVASELGKSPREVTSDDIDEHIEAESSSAEPSHSDCSECGDKNWVHYCPECHRSDD